MRASFHSDVRAQHPRDFSIADKLVEDISSGRVYNQPPTPEEQGNSLSGCHNLGGERRRISRGSASRAEMQRDWQEAR